MLSLWRWGATSASERRILLESAERRDRLHAAAVARRRKGEARRSAMSTPARPEVSTSGQVDDEDDGDTVIRGSD